MGIVCRNGLQQLTQALLDQLLGVEISRGAIATIRERLSASLEQPADEALTYAR